jgi:glycolate oxidase
MNFNKLTPEIIEELKAILPEERLFFQKESLQKYSHDETEDLSFYPEAAALPESAEEVSALVKLCNNHRIPITPRGAGTGLSGAALPVFGGLVISMERMNKLIKIDERNLQVYVEPGLITEELIDAVAEKGLLYPVDPASKGSCFIGGNISHGSGGPQVVKYGTIREYVLNLQVVLPTGEIIWTGANTLKFASGYNLTQLMIGSEGTLGIVTQAVLKLIPKPQQDMLLMASFPSNESACEAVSAIFRAGQTPSAVEFMERKGVEWVIEHDNMTYDLQDNVAAFLLIQVDGNSQDELFNQCEVINEVLEANGCFDVLLADTAGQKEALWNLRRTMAVSVKSNAVYKEEDTVVPRAELPQLIKGIKEIGNRYGFESVCYGHAGDGNLHVNIIKTSMSDEDWKNKLPAGIEEIFKLTVALGGTLSGEHGIGYVQKNYMPIMFSEVHLSIMRGIKKVFDPNNIMNPGKVFN